MTLDSVGRIDSEILLMHYLDCVSYKLLVFLCLLQELVSEPAGFQLPFQALQLIGRNTYNEQTIGKTYLS